MELELNMKELECCEKTQRLVISHEEAAEMAIPEYCPDIARVVDAVGQLKVREKKLSGTQLLVSGTVKVSVLYTSEESAGLRSLVVSVPFSCTVDDQRLAGCRSICASGHLQLVEARAVAARRVYVRVMPEFEVEGIRCLRHNLCEDTAQEPTLHLKREEKEAQLLTGVLERSFLFNQECMPEPGRGVPEDLLLDRIALRVTACQRLSSKLILKGEAALSLLYRTEAQDLNCCETVLPFSQIMDGMDLPEDATYQVEVWAEESDVRLIRTEAGPGFGVSMRIGVLVKIYERKKLCYISDLYSTKYDADVHCQAQTILAPQPSQTLRHEVTQQLEFGQGRPFACVSGMECSGVTMTAEGDQTSLHTNLRVKILYLDESGTPVSTERTVQATVQLPYLPEAARASCAPVVVNMGSNSCELRIPVDFFAEQTRKIRLNTLERVELSEPEETQRPSVVLCRVSENAALWDIAKAYRTDPAVIERVNGLETGAPLPQGMLLIPRVR